MDQLSSVIKELGKCLWDPLMRHVAYIVCYGRYVKMLETQVQKLEEKRDEIQQDVDAAVRQGESVRGNVQKWLAKVDDLKSEAETVTAASANTKCCEGWCWNPVLCYRLGKEAMEKLDDVHVLQREGVFERVSRPPPPPTTESLLPTSGFRSLESIKAPMTSVLYALQDEEVRIIGVYGIGGVGKTTLMQEVARKAAREKLFDEVVMVTVSQNVMIEKIQKEIAEKLGLKLVEDSVSVRVARLSERLRQVGKLLLILDDVWESLELTKVGILHGDEHKGCKIVITTRSLQVCNMMKSQTTIKVKALSDDDSWSLFTASAGPIANSPELLDVARSIVRECQGLPLAIVVIGRALSNESESVVWNGVLERLKQSVPKDIEGLEKQVFQSMKFSFDHLGSGEAKLCFLFCCLFPEDRHINFKHVTRIMIGEGQIRNVETLKEVESRVIFLFHKLQASGLLLEGHSKGFNKMHDIIRDVAVWIASDKYYGFYSRAGVGLKVWPRSLEGSKYQRISLMDNDIRVLPETPLNFPNLRTLLLSGNRGLKRIPDRFFSQMKALEVLELGITRISTLPTSLSCLTSLRVLNLDDCSSLKDLSAIGKLKRLEIFILRKNWKIDALPTDFGELSNLRFLDLSETSCNIPPNMISRLSSLENLQILNGFNEWQEQGSEDVRFASFTELASLPRLRILRINVINERCFSQDLQPDAFRNLLEFFIWPFVSPHEMLWENLFAITALIIPAWAKLLVTKSEKLIFQYCSGMECLIGAGGGNIPSNIFSSIKFLYLSEMKDLEEICRGAPPYGFLSKLIEFEVKNCYRLKKIFSDLVPRVKQLKRLELDNLPQLTRIWELDMPLKSLRRLVVRNCDKLTTIFSCKQVRRLEFLEELIVRRCPSMVAIITSEGESSKEKAIEDNNSVLPRLRILELHDLKITSFSANHASLFDWPSLKDVAIVGCPNLKKLPLSPNGGQKLQTIWGSKHWFDALEWEDEGTRARLKTLLYPILY